MKAVTVSCPASISLLFRSCPDKTLVKMGSLGVGFTVDRRIEVSVRPGVKSNILFNSKPIIFPTVASVIHSLTDKPVIINIKSSLPLGFGFGISSASSLAAAYALNKLLYLHKSKIELVKVAHIAEIINKTGLGSVGTQTTGGFLVKTSPGIPVSAIRYPFIGKKIYAAIIGKLETPRILKNPAKIKKINQSADLTMQIIHKLTHPTLEKFIDLSYQSAKTSGLLTNQNVINLIEKIINSGGHATMAKLGNVVISNIRPKTHYRVEELIITDSSINDN